jgi:ubiquinone/menaquinone biosynthesis C-methylase UbiE
MERLVHAVELLDGPLDDPGALAGNLRDLGRVNRWLGGVAISEKAIETIAVHRPDISLLDVGTGGADIPIELVRRSMRHGRGLRIVALDSRPEIIALAAQRLDAARPLDPAGTRSIELKLGDGLALPYPDRSFDVAHASMVTHHLEPPQVLELFDEMGRVSRLGIVINDLVRSRPAWLGAVVLTRLTTGNRYTRHDAPLSVQRAYRRVDLAAMLVQAGFAPVRTIGAIGGHRVAIAAVHGPRLRPPPEEL